MDIATGGRDDFTGEDGAEGTAHSVYIPPVMVSSLSLRGAAGVILVDHRYPITRAQIDHGTSVTAEKPTVADCPSGTKPTKQPDGNIKCEQIPVWGQD